MKNSTRVGLISRLDFGGDHARHGIQREAYKIFSGGRSDRGGEEEPVHFVVLAGGLVSESDLKAEHKRVVAPIWKEKKKLPKSRRPLLADIKEEQRDILIDRYVRVIAQVLPNTGLFKTYIVTSPVYDGSWGKEIARKLALVREDVVYFGEHFSYMRLKQANGEICIITPPKTSPFREQYFSTSVQREVNTVRRMTERADPRLYIVGGVASHVVKPAGGEFPVTVTSLPAASRIGNVRIAEHQIGASVVEISSDRAELPRVIFYSLKDAVGREYRCIRVPKEVSRNAKAVVDAIKREGGGMSEGVLADELGWDRDRVKKAIAEVTEKMGTRFYLDSASHRLDLRPEYLRVKATHQLVPPGAKVYEDRVVGFGCLHALYYRQASRFFSERIPEMMLKMDANVLVAAGDQIAGLGHNLDRSGQVVAGVGYTEQETFAARQVAAALAKVFDGRLRANLTKLKVEDSSGVDPEVLEMIIRESLPSFYYIIGNHDEWPRRDGHEPLAIFDLKLRDILKAWLYDSLKRHRIDLPLRLTSIVNDHVCRAEEGYDRGDYQSRIITLPSGVTMEAFHPYMGRTKTWTIRAQTVLGFSKAQIAFIANFHAGVAVQEWQEITGQRVGFQLGTILTGTDFEKTKLKDVDNHFGYLRVVSAMGRVIATETVYCVPRDRDEHKPFYNRRIVEDFARELGILEPRSF